MLHDHRRRFVFIFTIIVDNTGPVVRHELSRADHRVFCTFSYESLCRVCGALCGPPSSTSVRRRTPFASPFSGIIRSQSFIFCVYLATRNLACPPSHHIYDELLCATELHHRVYRPYVATVLRQLSFREQYRIGCNFYFYHSVAYHIESWKLSSSF